MSAIHTRGVEFRAESGRLYWGDHVGDSPVNYLEVCGYIVETEEFIRRLLQCRNECKTFALTHHKCKCSSQEGGPEPGIKPEVMGWYPTSQYPLIVCGMIFSRVELVLLLTWFEQNEAWYPNGRRPLHLTDEERVLFEELKAFADQLALT